MPKQGEVDYVKHLAEAEVAYLVDKPFADPGCGRYLAELGTVLQLLPAPPARLLDLGCGSGWTSCFFARRGYHVTGQDIAPDMIAQARIQRDRQGLSNLDFRVGDYESLDFFAEFDAAVFFDSLHHSLSEESALRAVYRALKPGGICITSEPGIGHARSAESVAAMRRFNVTERDMPPARIIRAAKKAGFRRYRIYPQTRDLQSWLYGQPHLPAWKRWLKSNPLCQALALLVWTAIMKRYQGMVVLTKPGQSTPPTVIQSWKLRSQHHEHASSVDRPVPGGRLDTASGRFGPES